MAEPEAVRPRDSYLILGASGGIGSALSRILAESNARLFLTARDRSRLRSVAAETRAEFRCIDATSFHEVEDCAREAADRLGSLDGIVNCVGSILLKPAHLTSEDDWTETVSQNLGSAFAAVRSAAKVMRRGGAVVLVSSAAATLGLANHEAIAAAKAGVAGLTRAAAATYASRNLRFNAVAPGLVRTPLTERILSNAAALQASTSLHALGRIGEPEEVARSIAWLLSSDQSWITGQVLGIDGGLARVRSRGA